MFVSFFQNIFRLRKEGYFYIFCSIIFFIYSVFFLQGILVCIALFFLLWVCYFFRDPIRIVPNSKEIIISSADGVICNIELKNLPKELSFFEDSKMMCISIFMDIFDCHVNRSPVQGKILDIIYNKGKFFNASLDKASHENERKSYLIENNYDRFVVVQIAGLVARRIVSFVENNQIINQGDRIGLIKFGSRVDVYFPQKYKLSVSVGQVSVAGETVIATLQDKKNEIIYSKI